MGSNASSRDAALNRVSPVKCGVFAAIPTDTVHPADCCYDHFIAPHLPMSEDQLNAFLEKVKGDTSLQEQLKSAKSPEDVVGIAKEHGHEITADRINQIREEELEEILGGRLCPQSFAKLSCNQYTAKGYCTNVICPRL